MLKKCLGAVLILVLFLSVSASALVFKTGDSITIPKGEVINDNLFVSGNMVTINGTVRGNLLAFGSTVVINGNISGSVISGGQDVSISSRLNNLLVGGRTVSISGQSNNVIVGGETVNISGSVSKDLIAGGKQIILQKSSKIGGDAFLGARDTNVAGKIGRNLNIGSNNIIIDSAASVRGNFTYTAQKPVISDQAKIAGTVTIMAQPKPVEKSPQLMSGWFSFQKVIGFLMILLLGILIIIFMPHQVELVTDKMRKHCWRSFGWGILALIVLPIIAVLLMITLVGIPLGTILLFAYLVGAYIASIFVSIVIGKWILDKVGKSNISLIWSLLLGLIILNIVGLIPIIGGLVIFVLFLWAFGALVATRPTTYVEARDAKIL
ncbi:MAG: hypothetical protein KKB81_01485 [Candidatus Margulisbacteria bacterium]|nr:hypothetical protein [Candidatus Margulisiibacteriota bacterium]MBU1021587.1 hypothetical protein [Candidatus Margulisiibacteriota bacterium]MBU1728738.1 hypothetical protein [Candidatus Margulisiibacteriota bacterium]MBU1955704.1 hypothetical protein [Candidatus Margulisiibacteriota bacterium]